MIIEILLVLLSLVVGGIFYWNVHMRNMEKYWPKRGFHYLSMEDIGTTLYHLIVRTTPLEWDKKAYNILKTRNQPFAGFLELDKPTVFIRDPELLKQIMVKDFDHFVNRRFGITKVDGFTGKMIFFMESEPWKELRATMSPTFTTGKIRRMFKILENCGGRLVDFLTKEIKVSSTANMDEAFGKYTVDVISSAAFGLESGAFKEKKSMFETMAEKLQVKMSPRDVIAFIAFQYAPTLSNWLKMSIFNPEPCEFFSSIISKAIGHRRSTSQKREDFLQLMLETSAGKLKAEEEELDVFEKDAAVKARTKASLTDEEICAQSVLFFLAGFDTTQTLLQFAAYQLAVCPEIQEKLAQEVIQSYKQNGGKFTYESINEMEYMDKFVAETLRMYPPVTRLDRRCTADYKIPGTDCVIPTGNLVILPTFAIHYDEDIYPDPKRFDPERFTKEAKAERSPYAYLPFGHGPRNCIGMRFALTEAKLGIAHLVRSFVFEPSEKTPIPMVFAYSGTLKPEGGIWLNLKPRKY